MNTGWLGVQTSQELADCGEGDSDLAPLEMKYVFMQPSIAPGIAAEFRGAPPAPVIDGAGPEWGSAENEGSEHRATADEILCECVSTLMQHAISDEPERFELLTRRAPFLVESITDSAQPRDRFEEALESKITSSCRRGLIKALARAPEAVD